MAECVKELFLTTLVMSPAARHSMLRDFHGWHGVVLGLFPGVELHGQKRTANKSVLFRVENGRVLVQSTHAPDAKNFSHPTVLVASSRKIDLDIPEVVHVQLVMGSYQRYGNRVRPVMTAQQKIWLFEDRVCRTTGSEAIDIDPGPTFYSQSRDFVYREAGDSEVRNVTHPVANWVATLRLKNKNAFVELMTLGVGRGRSSGCGMIVVS